MRVFKFLIQLIILSLLLTTCSKDENGDIVPDLTKNAFYINNNEYLIKDGLVANSGGEGLQDNYDYIFILYSSGISFDTNYAFYEGLSGVGDVIIIEITTKSWDGPKLGAYSTDNEEGEQRIEDIMCFINYNPETWASSNMYYFSSATMELWKEEGEYEITINALGEEFNQNDEIIDYNVQLVANYNGILPEYDFLIEDPADSKFDADTINFTIGIDYAHPENTLFLGKNLISVMRILK